jgi:hypothetical protein
VTLWLPPREAERQRLEEQAERQRQRAPEPGVEIPEPPRAGPRQFRYKQTRFRGRVVRASSIPWWIWLLSLSLVGVGFIAGWIVWVIVLLVVCALIPLWAL